jgi:glycosyltransferase involved in cell wall biosynthesis
MKISVIMPVYNRERYVGMALRSLLRQSGDADLDIVVVDDGSTDASRDVVRSLIDEGGPIRLIAQENQGVTRARNTGLRNLLPETSLVTFLDSDDVSPAGRFAADLPHFADPSVEFVYGRICMVDHLDETTMEPRDDARRETMRTIQLAAAIFRRDYLGRVGEFDEEFRQAEDTDLLFRAFEMRSNAVLTDTIGVYYRQHPEGLTSNKAEGRREFLKALTRSALRRRRDPSLSDLKPVFGGSATGPTGATPREDRMIEP